MYEKFYKLSSKPFQLTPNLEFLYASKGHKQALSYLFYGIEQGEGFVVITGNIGSGKTTLIQALLAELKGRDIAVASLAAANLDTTNLLAMVCASFGLPYEARSKVALIKELEDLLFRYQERNSQVLLVVDEAQTLTPSALEELRILSNLELRGKAALQIFLVGQIELRDTILSSDFEQLRQRVIASYNLKVFSSEETEEYVKFRLNKAGWKDDPELKDELFPSIHEWSKGIPRRINLLCDRLMIFGYLEELHQLNADHLKQVMEEMSHEIVGEVNTDLQKNKTLKAIDEKETISEVKNAAAKPGVEVSIDERLSQLENKVTVLADELAVQTEKIDTFIRIEKVT